MIFMPLFIILGLFGGSDPDISRRLASGAIGCPAKEVGISNEEARRGVHTFTAHCKGVEYYCTYKHPAPIQCTRQAGVSDEDLEKHRIEIAAAMAEWKKNVYEHVSSHWKPHKDYEPPMSVTIRVRLDEHGNLLNLRWVSKSPNRSVDKSILKAFKKSNPYPAPPDPGPAFTGVEFVFPHMPD